MNKLFSNKKQEKGQGLVEYAIILALIAIVVVGVMTTLGKKVCNTMNGVSNSLDGGSGSNCVASAPIGSNSPSYTAWGGNWNTQALAAQDFCQGQHAPSGSSYTFYRDSNDGNYSAAGAGVTGPKGPTWSSTGVTGTCP